MEQRLSGTDNDIDKEFLELMDFFNGELATAEVAKEMQEKFGVSLEQADVYLREYGEQLF